MTNFQSCCVKYQINHLRIPELAYRAMLSATSDVYVAIIRPRREVKDLVFDHFPLVVMRKVALTGRVRTLELCAKHLLPEWCGRLRHCQCNIFEHPCRMVGNRFLLHIIVDQSIDITTLIRVLLRFYRPAAVIIIRRLII
jgi:hypothetical protein